MSPAPEPAASQHLSHHASPGCKGSCSTHARLWRKDKKESWHLLPQGFRKGSSGLPQGLPFSVKLSQVRPDPGCSILPTPWCLEPLKRKNSTILLLLPPRPCGCAHGLELPLEPGGHVASGRSHSPKLQDQAACARPVLGRIPQHSSPILPFFSPSNCPAFGPGGTYQTECDQCWGPGWPLRGRYHLFKKLEAEANSE